MIKGEQEQCWGEQVYAGDWGLEGLGLKGLRGLGLVGLPSPQATFYRDKKELRNRNSQKVGSVGSGKI